MFHINKKSTTKMVSPFFSFLFFFFYLHLYFILMKRIICYTSVKRCYSTSMWFKPRILRQMNYLFNLKCHPLLYFPKFGITSTFTCSRIILPPFPIGKQSKVASSKSLYNITIKLSKLSSQCDQPFKIVDDD